MLSFQHEFRPTERKGSFSCMDIFPPVFRPRRVSAPVSQEKDKFGASEKAQIRKETHPTFFESQCLRAADS